MALLHPVSELVALAWIQATTGIDCGMTLPEDYTTWAANGFVTTGNIGGSPAVHMPVRNPVVSIDCWAVASSSPRPPFLQAAQLAETVYAAMQPTSAKRQVDPNTVVTPTGNTYLHAHVLSIYALTEPRPVLGDEAGFAHYSLDIALRWVAATS